VENSISGKFFQLYGKLLKSTYLPILNLFLLILIFFGWEEACLSSICGIIAILRKYCRQAKNDYSQGNYSGDGKRLLKLQDLL
jgi:hypothetical protein